MLDHRPLNRPRLHPGRLLAISSTPTSIRQPRACATNDPSPSPCPWARWPGFWAGSGQKTRALPPRQRACMCCVVLFFCIPPSHQVRHLCNFNHTSIHDGIDVCYPLSSPAEPSPKKIWPQHHSRPSGPFTPSLHRSTLHMLSTERNWQAGTRILSSTSTSTWTWTS